jgi:hypothetical protein
MIVLTYLYIILCGLALVPLVLFVLFYLAGRSINRHKNKCDRCRYQSCLEGNTCSNPAAPMYNKWTGCTDGCELDLKGMCR